MRSDKRRRIGTSRIFAALLGTVLFLSGWWFLPLLLYRHTGTGPEAKLKAITDTRTAFLAGLVGLGALLTFWLNRKTYEISTRTLQLAEKGHAIDRYTRAIEHLGSTSLDVRLGGIYALGRLIKDSPNEDQKDLFDVLTAFVREHGGPPSEDPTDHIEHVKPRVRPRSDVQAALDVLTLLPRSRRDRLDLSRSYLVGADLFRADLSNVDFFEADLSRADLSYAVLVGANLRRARLEGTVLEGADLAEADLTQAILLGTFLNGADLTGASLESAILTQALLRDADMMGASLTSATLTGAHLSNALNLTQDQIRLTVGDADTDLPPSVSRPEHWIHRAG